MLWLILAACSETWVDPFPAPDAWGATTGPGGPTATFPSEQLFEPCSWLTGGPEDIDHHNHVVMVDGYLLMPWAPETGGGGISFFDVSDPCAPVEIGRGYSPLMRESHTIGLSLGERRYAAVDYLGGRELGGVGIWDITDVTAPAWVSHVDLPDHRYPDSYTRLTLSVTWQGRYIYASTAALGVYIIDAIDPLAPTVVGQLTFGGPHLVGTFHVWGSQAMASSAGLSRTVLVDLPDPLTMEPVANGDFVTEDPDGTQRPYYFSNVGSRWGLFARSKDGGGPMVYDIANPAAPTFVGRDRTDEGDGGYVFQHGDRLFVGDSAFGTVYDFADPAHMVPLGTFSQAGDLDTVTPIGNVAMISVDEDAVPGQATSVQPWTEEPDHDGPTPGMTSPTNGAFRVPTTARLGVVFDEMIEPVSVFSGSFRVSGPDGAPVPGVYNVQENIVNFTPDADLEADSTYQVVLPDGGLTDYNGNPMKSVFLWRFTTGSAR